MKKIIILYITILLFLSCEKELSINDFSDDFSFYETELRIEGVIYPSENTAIDTLCPEMYEIDDLNEMELPGLPKAKLKLKLDCPVMLLRNFNPTKGHCNGSRYIIEKFYYGKDSNGNRNEEGIKCIKLRMPW